MYRCNEWFLHQDPLQTFAARGPSTPGAPETKQTSAHPANSFAMAALQLSLFTRVSSEGLADRLSANGASGAKG